MNKRSSGGSKHSLNNASTRGALADPQTYGMLLWQSKLQDKLLQEQKENRQRELEEQQTKIREKQQQQSQPQEMEQGHQSHSPTSIVEIPQMIPGPAPFTVTLSTPRKPHSPHQPSFTAAVGDKLPIGGMLASVDQPMFPNIRNHVPTSVSCDNLEKPTARFLGNIISFQQMGGAGSPRRSPSGKLLTVLRGDPEIRYHQNDTRGFDQTIRYLMDREKVIQYKRELDHQIEEKRKWRSRLGSAAVKEITRKSFIENGGNNTNTSTASDHLRRHHPGSTYSDRVSAIGIGNNKSGIELAPLMRKFNSLPKLNTLSSTDVTRPYVHSPRNEFFHPVKPNEVAENLSSQLREKEWLSRKQQETDRLATERHFQTWDNLWGRPGAGAPMIPFGEKNLSHAVSFGNIYGAPQQRLGYNKVNLFNALHMTHKLQKPK